MLARDGEDHGREVGGAATTRGVVRMNPNIPYAFVCTHEITRSSSSHPPTSLVGRDSKLIAKRQRRNNIEPYKIQYNLYEIERNDSYSCRLQNAVEFYSGDNKDKCTAVCIANRSNISISIPEHCRIWSAVSARIPLGMPGQFRLLFV